MFDSSLNTAVNPYDTKEELDKPSEDIVLAAGEIPDNPFDVNTTTAPLYTAQEAAPVTAAAPAYQGVDRKVRATNTQYAANKDYKELLGFNKHAAEWGSKWDPTTALGKQTWMDWYINSSKAEVQKFLADNGVSEADLVSAMYDFKTGNTADITWDEYTDYNKVLGYDQYAGKWGDIFNADTSGGREHWIQWFNSASAVDLSKYFVETGISADQLAGAIKYFKAQDNYNPNDLEFIDFNKILGYDKYGENWGDEWDASDVKGKKKWISWYESAGSDEIQRYLDQMGISHARLGSIIDSMKLAVLEDKYNPDDIAKNQYDALNAMLRAYRLSQDEYRRLAEMMMDSTYLDKFQEIIDQYKFDASQYRNQAQYAITQGGADLANQTLAQLIRNGALNSSAGAGYQNATQAKYYTQQLSKLEDTIHQYEQSALDAQAKGYQSLESMSAAQRDAYAQLAGHAADLGVAAQKDYFDGLAKLRQGEIDWATFKANYLNPDGKDEDGIKWGDHTITDDEWAEIGLDIKKFLGVDFKYNEKKEYDNGYSVWKERVGETDVIHYEYEGKETFKLVVDPNMSASTLARTLWNKLDDKMKDQWAKDYWGDDGDKKTDNYWDKTGFNLTDEQGLEIGSDIPKLWEALPDDGSWTTMNIGGTDYQVQKYLWKNQDEGTAGYTLKTDYILIKDPATGKTINYLYDRNVTANPKYQGVVFFNTFKKLFGNYWNDLYKWGY